MRAPKSIHGANLYLHIRRDARDNSLSSRQASTEQVKSHSASSNHIYGGSTPTTFWTSSFYCEFCTVALSAHNVIIGSVARAAVCMQVRAFTGVEFWPTATHGFQHTRQHNQSVRTSRGVHIGVSCIVCRLCGRREACMCIRIELRFDGECVSYELAAGATETAIYHKGGISTGWAVRWAMGRREPRRLHKLGHVCNEFSYVRRANQTWLCQPTTTDQLTIQTSSHKYIVQVDGMQITMNTFTKSSVATTTRFHHATGYTNYPMH